MRQILPVLAAALLAGPAAAQREPEWRSARAEPILLRPFAYEPRRVRLEAGQPVRLEFVNNSQATLSLSAPRFFRAARLRGRDARLVADGRLRLAPGERRTIALVPTPGRYRVYSGNLAHRLLGMSAEILVE